MKKCHVPAYYFFEFFCVLSLFVIPPILHGWHGYSVVYPRQPQSSIEVFRFVFFVYSAALFEELLYRLYIPRRLQQFCTVFLAKSQNVVIESLPVILFGVAHLSAGVGVVVYALVFGGLFRFVFVYFSKKWQTVPAVLLLSVIHACHNFVVYYIFLF